MSKTARMMKDSGIEWIGQIPATWETRKNKYLLDFMYSGGTPTATNDSFYTDKDGTPFVSIADLTKSYLVTETAKCVTEEGILNKKLRTLPPGTLLYSIYATIGAVAELGINATISQAILALGINVRKVNKDFYKYNLLAMHDYIVSEANSNSQDNLNAQKVSNFIFPLTPLPEQTRIAAYLDEKCGKIDAVIAGEEAIIEKLKGYKQSLITETVTKGLDPKVPMKDSGIEWIGEIPAGWEVCRIKNILSILTDFTANGSFADLAKNVIYHDFIDYARLVRLTDLRDDLNNTGVYVDRHAYEYLSKSKLFGGEILIANVGAYAGYFCEMPKATMPSTLAPNMFLIRTNTLMLQHFLYYLGKSKFVSEQLEQKASMTTAQPKLNKDNVKTVLIPLPPLPEQKQIAAYLDKKCAAIDSNIASRQSLIEKLTAYKKSLIYEIVTGKKEI